MINEHIKLLYICSIILTIWMAILTFFSIDERRNNLNMKKDVAILVHNDRETINDLQEIVDYLKRNK